VTEQEWLTCDDPQPMIAVFVKLSRDPVQLDRQRRLFCVACCRLIWDDVLTPLHREAVDTGELFAMGQIPGSVLTTVRERLYPNRYLPQDGAIARLLPPVWGAIAPPSTRNTISPNLIELESSDIQDARGYLGQLWGRYHVGPAPPDASNPSHPWHREFQAGVEEVNQLMADYLVCIVGNPFRPLPPFDAAWRSSSVMGLAQGIDADRAFDRMPILADALEDAGCDDASVLSHCRGAVNHTRGCWVVEQVLNRRSK
jgi:hypothetical protein